jgi:hypothetical protein
LGAVVVNLIAAPMAISQHTERFSAELSGANEVLAVNSSGTARLRHDDPGRCDQLLVEFCWTCHRPLAWPTCILRPAKSLVA